MPSARDDVGSARTSHDRAILPVRSPTNLRTLCGHGSLSPRTGGCFMLRLNSSTRLVAVALVVVVAESCSKDATRPTMLPDGRLMSAAAISIDLDQCANDPRTIACSWQNGDLNGNNSTYAEGLVVPFRAALEGLSPGTHTIHINY